MAGEMIGYGIQVQMALTSAPTVFTTLDGVFDFVAPKDVFDDVDVTHYGSPNRKREFIAGLGDSGEASFEMNHVPGSATDVYLRAAKGNPRVIKVTYPNGATVTFNGNIREYGADGAPVDDKLTAMCTVKVTGDPVFGGAVAPVNSVLPSVSGLPKVGVVLTAYPGVWTGAPAFTYQWKKTGVNIGGATMATYTPVAGDIGAPISVEVTGTNATGNAVATSTNTINVVA